MLADNLPLLVCEAKPFCIPSVGEGVKEPGDERGRGCRISRVEENLVGMGQRKCSVADDQSCTGVMPVRSKGLMDCRRSG